MKGETRIAAPPRVSSSAARRERRSSVSVRPPSAMPMNSPSGFSARRIWISAPGRSLTQCRLRAETIRDDAERCGDRGGRRTGADHIADAGGQVWIDAQGCFNDAALRAEVQHAVKAAGNRGETLRNVFRRRFFQERVVIERPGGAGPAQAMQPPVENPRGAVWDDGLDWGGGSWAGHLRIM
jgi:hypothetical protein